MRVVIGGSIVEATLVVVSHGGTAVVLVVVSHGIFVVAEGKRVVVIDGWRVVV